MKTHNFKGGGGQRWVFLYYPAEFKRCFTSICLSVCLHFRPLNFINITGNLRNIIYYCDLLQLLKMCVAFIILLYFELFSLKQIQIVKFVVNITIDDTQIIKAKSETKLK